MTDTGLVELADISLEDLQRNSQAIERGKVTYRGPPRTCVWFVPIVDHPLKGGIRTAFMIAESFSTKWGTLNYFVLYSLSSSSRPIDKLTQLLRKHFPKMRFVAALHRRGLDKVESVPYSDIAFCTLWTTAYLLLKYNRTGRKFYLMQDFEPSFYAAGDVYGVIEQTYRFGFSCIANTPGVANRCACYSDNVVWFKPGVDQSVYFSDSDKTCPGSPFRIVFYGRPSNPRNCFHLGSLTLKGIKRKLGDAVEIVSVGENWDESQYDLGGIVKNIGLLSSLKEVADLYRGCDLGLVFMMTPHPSYQPLEYMASGCVVATNINEANSWLLNQSNALLVEPIPELAAEKIQAFVGKRDLWKSKRDRALETIRDMSWESALQTIHRAISE